MSCFLSMRKIEKIASELLCDVNSWANYNYSINPCCNGQKVLYFADELLKTNGYEESYISDNGFACTAPVGAGWWYCGQVVLFQ